VAGCCSKICPLDDPAFDCELPGQTCQDGENYLGWPPGGGPCTLDPWAEGRVLGPRSLSASRRMVAPAGVRRPTLTIRLSPRQRGFARFAAGGRTQ
jgi:hypothetical protein